jgi:transposase
VSTKSVMGTTATGRRNRSWPEALKREIVAASFAASSSVSMIARQYDVNANRVFGWRKLYRDEPRAPAVLSAPQLVTAEPDAAATQPAPGAATIEIDRSGKYRVRVGGVDAQGLRRDGGQQGGLLGRFDPKTGKNEEIPLGPGAARTAIQSVTSTSTACSSPK